MKMYFLFIVLFCITACQTVMPDPKPPDTVPNVQSKSSGPTGKLAMSFNFASNDTISADDFIEIKGFRTQAAIADIAKAQLKVSGETFGEISRTMDRQDLNTGKTMVIKDLPVGIVDVSVTLLDQANKTLSNSNQLIKVVANQIIPVNFDLTLDDGEPTNPNGGGSPTGGLAISINVKEETRLFGALEASKKVINVGEPVQIRVKETQGDVILYQFDMADSNDIKLSSQSTVTYQFDEPGTYNIQAILVGEQNTFRTAAEGKSSGYSYVTEPCRVEVKGTSRKLPTFDHFTNNQVVQVIKKVADNPIFELIKNSDSQNELHVLNRQIATAIKKGTLKTISVFGKAVNALEIYDEWANGVNGINGLGAIDSNLSVSAADRSRLKALLALEIFLRHFGKHTVGGSAVPQGLFRRTAMDFLNYNQMLNEALEDYSQVNLVVRAGLFGTKQVDVFVKLVPVKIREKNPSLAYHEWPITDNPSSKYIKSGVTDKKGQVRLSNVPPGLWAVTMEKNFKKTTTRLIRVEPNSATHLGDITHSLKMDN